MPEGIVKWFNREMGAGFIRTIGDNPRDIFFRQDVVANSPSGGIKGGRKVAFDIQERISGLSPTAKNVKILD